MNAGLLDGGTQMATRKDNDGRQMETKWQIIGTNENSGQR